jgi:hypothetical protein
MPHVGCGKGDLSSQTFSSRQLCSLKPQSPHKSTAIKAPKRQDKCRVYGGAKGLGEILAEIKGFRRSSQTKVMIARKQGQGEMQTRESLCQLGFSSRGRNLLPVAKSRNVKGKALSDNVAEKWRADMSLREGLLLM